VYSARGPCARRIGHREGHVTLTDEAGLVVAVAVLMRRIAALIRHAMNTWFSISKPYRYDFGRACTALRIFRTAGRQIMFTKRRQESAANFYPMSSIGWSRFPSSCALAIRSKSGASVNRTPRKELIARFSKDWSRTRRIGVLERRGFRLAVLHYRSLFARAHRPRAIGRPATRTRVSL